MQEVRGELRKVAWPTRSETINYSIIVLVALVVMTTFIFGIDWVFSQFVLKLFNAMSSSMTDDSPTPDDQDPMPSSPPKQPPTRSTRRRGRRAAEVEEIVDELVETAVEGEVVEPRSLEVVVESGAEGDEVEAVEEAAARGGHRRRGGRGGRSRSWPRSADEIEAEIADEIVEVLDEDALLEEAAAARSRAPTTGPAAGSWSTRSRATRRRSSRTSRPASRP